MVRGSALRKTCTHARAFVSSDTSDVARRLSPLAFGRSPTEAMSCVTATVGSVYFVRWRLPEVEDMQRIVRDVATQRRERGKLLTFVALAPESSSPPGAAARQHMPILMNSALDHCDEMHLVFEGTGFSHSVKRSVMAAVFLAGGKRDRVHVHARVQEILRAQPRPDIAQSLRILALQGLLSDLPSGRFRAADPAARLPNG